MVLCTTSAPIFASLLEAEPALEHTKETVLCRLDGGLQAFLALPLGMRGGGCVRRLLLVLPLSLGQSRQLALGVHLTLDVALTLSLRLNLPLGVGLTLSLSLGLA